MFLRHPYSVASSLNVFIVAPLFGNLETDRFCDNYSLLLEFIQCIHLLHWKNAADMDRCYVKDNQYIYFVLGIISLLKAHTHNTVHNMFVNIVFFQKFSMSMKCHFLNRRIK